MPRSPVPAPFSDRIRGLRQACAAHEVDGLLLQSRVDQRWLTGFTGEDGAVLLTRRAVVLLTDGRFDETADREAPWARKVVRRARGPESIAAEVKRAKLQRLAFDESQMSVATLRALKKALGRGGAKLIGTPGWIAERRVVKSADEIKAIRKAIRVAEKAFVAMRKELRAGMTELEVAGRLEFEMKRRGASGPSFATIVASGPNASLPHATPGTRKLKATEPVLIDWGARVDGYVSDLTRMVYLGRVSPQLAAIRDIVHGAQRYAIEQLTPRAAQDYDGFARRYIAEYDYADRFTHSLGHGIGLDVHEAPGLRRGQPLRLEPGTIVTIEPGIYLPGVGGVRIEDDVLITARGYEVLTSLPHEVPTGRYAAHQPPAWIE